MLRVGLCDEHIGRPDRSVCRHGCKQGLDESRFAVLPFAVEQEKRILVYLAGRAIPSDTLQVGDLLLISSHDVMNKLPPNFVVAAKGGCTDIGDHVGGIVVKTRSIA